MTDQRDRKMQELCQHDVTETDIDDQARHLLVNYSKLAPSEVLPHVLRMRDEAFAITPYPCIAQLRFLLLKLSRLPIYPRFLARLRSDPSTTFLDAGCCVGQELRGLAAQDGIRGEQLFGTDLVSDYIDVGFRLFRDRETLGRTSTFVQGDLLAQPAEAFERSKMACILSGKMDLVFASSLLHLWDYPEQLTALMRLVSLCRPRAGSEVAGRQVGSLLGGRYLSPKIKNKDEEKNKDNISEPHRATYRHNLETIRGLWHDVGERTDTTWTVEAGFLPTTEPEVQNMKDTAYGYDNMLVMWWCATRKR